MGDRLSPDRGYLPLVRVARMTTYLAADALEKALSGAAVAYWEVLPEHAATLECGHELRHKGASRMRVRCWLCGPAGGPPGKGEGVSMTLDGLDGADGAAGGGAAGDTSPATIRYAGEPCRLHWHRYAEGGRPALRLSTLDGEPMASVTVNVPEAPLAPGEVLIHHDCVAMGRWPELEASGLFADTGRRVESGFVSLMVCRLLKGPAWARGEGA